ncbi:MAG: dimethylsulfonioproprionate lyase family protein, partial [Pseudomonadota bacterium]
WELYRYLPAGGSDRIRSHQRTVREAISRVMQSDPEIRLPEPCEKPVIRHLKRALDEGRQERTSQLLAALEAVLPSLAWLYGYEKVPRGLENRFAFAELAGPRGPVVTERIILGLVLFAPSCTYPAHAHDGITESYICLSGAVSENHQGVYVPGSFILNPPAHLHRITVGEREPALLAYAWVGRPEDLLEQKMVFTRSRKT